MLLHIVADENFKMQHLVFASKWVAEEFVKEAVHYELQVGPQCPLVRVGLPSRYCSQGLGAAVLQGASQTCCLINCRA